ncbi:DNA mismatch endonuclease Vsr [Burkholderia dolosa]|uniref:Very short patch repair endonuclease n=1 Tax=Burkholderia dolosa TaxID=152500 RepID=A0A892I6F5_9BURK|nr:MULTISPECIES: DNA mismatch endonuclease Vsr [Burkholderia]AJY12299.1 DNA mismatch endonuclease Vsr family protein [Burkholderia dolosa AU0158]AYZ97067.1 DNA mismatch endonuclease Vsr [Burkholderia dolosa]ETP64109.1 DNA glycosylase [Burkholderia dolosa PC543]MBR8421288.1 DNA mismatch endonuclease Vsr [Burkholderia dolosa]MBY4657679.1 DNA mismatch endonuclease Vsr [Burkholderia dolosa]
MTDVVDKETRSRMMSGIRGKDTAPELFVRRALHAKGFRYLLHSPNLPGRPDMVFPKYRAVIFVHGCFWHMHDCKYFKLPGSRTEFWRQKLSKNRQRDEGALETVQALGWRVLVIWECATRESRINQSNNALVENVAQWITSEAPSSEIGIDGHLHQLSLHA